MSTSVSLILIAGVPLLDLGAIERQSESIDETDRMGRQTGRKLTIQNVHFIAPNGQRFLIGSNEERIARGDLFHDYIDYFTETLFLDNKADEDEDCEWVHAAFSDDPESTLVGLELVQSGDNSIAPGILRCALPFPSDVMAATERVRIELNERFGYAGPIRIIAQAWIS